MEFIGKFLKTLIGAVLLFYGIMAIISGKRRHNLIQKEFEQNITEKNETIKYLLRTNQDSDYLIGTLMIAYGIDLIFQSII